MASKSTPPELDGCRNCGFTNLEAQHVYCPSCGQNIKLKRINFWHLIQDAFANVFNLESRLWLTLANLFIPGKLTKEFFKGRYQRYLSPFRIFLITGLFFFAVIKIVTSDAVTPLEGLSDGLMKESYYASFLEEMQVASDTVALAFPQPNLAKPVLDTLYVRMHEEVQDSVGMGVLDIFTEQPISDLMVARTDLVELSPDSIVRKYGNGNYWDEVLLRQNIRLQQSGSSFISFLLGQLLWMMIVLMPFLALCLKLIYVRRDFYYVDHVIFSFHVHAFMFVLLSFSLLAHHYYPETAFSSYLIRIGTIGIFVYFYSALKRVYGQSWIKTFIKYSFLLFCYGILFIVAILITSLLAAFFF